MCIRDRTKSDTGELFDLGRTAMHTNQSPRQGGMRNDIETKFPYGSSRLLFDEDIDDSNSTYDTQSRSKQFDSASATEPLQLGSTVLGDGTTNYSRVPTAPNTNLRKPENTFSSNTQYQGFSGSNPYLNENPSYNSFTRQGNRSDKTQYL